MHMLSISVIIAGALALRLTLVAAGWPTLDSDEGTMGLMARHIAYLGERPNFFSGQDYMGSLEAYLAAGMFRLFGASVFTLRLGTIALFGLFLLTIYLLSRLLYDRGLAFLTLFVLGLGSTEMLLRQVVATGGRLETMLFGSLALLLASWLALSRDVPISHRGRRTLAYAAWGLVVGAGIWSDLLILPLAGAAWGLLVYCCRREVLTRGAFPVLLGLLLGASPLIAHNLTAAPGADSWHVFRDLNRAGGTGTFVRVSLGQRLAGTLLVSLPAATGANTLCPPTPSVSQEVAAPPRLTLDRCAIIRSGWGVGYLILWGSAALLTVRALRRVRRGASARGWSLTAHRATRRYCARLAVLAGVGLTLALFASSPAPARDPWSNTRYLVGLLLAVPILLAPLWEAVKGHGPARVAGSITIISLLITLLLGTVGTARAVPEVRRANQEQYRLIDKLLANDATRVYSEYWTCNRLMFQSGERIACAVLEGDLRPGFDRDARYPALVRAAPAPTYLFPLGSPSATAFDLRLASEGSRYDKEVSAGYVVYWPTRLALIPLTDASGP